MFEDAEKELDQILKLVAKCPAPLQEKCFEMFLQAYLRPTAGEPVEPRRSGQHDTPPLPPADETGESAIPAEILGRFKTTAKRCGVELPALAKLFDFHTDPFTYHALNVPGKSKAEKARNVALLVAARTYLATGQWAADWKEVRARCVDQSCYDNTNMRKYIESPTHSYFKNLDAPSMTVASSGIKAAEALLTQLAAAS
jgi:hypothetical protein